LAQIHLFPLQPNARIVPKRIAAAQKLEADPMAVKDQKQGFLALTRFGFGPRGDGDLAAASLDPRGFLRAELKQPGSALLAGPGLPDSRAAIQGLFAQEEAQKAEREKLAQQVAMQTVGDPMTPSPDQAVAPKAPPKPLDELQSGLGDIWASTIVVAVTEFGRTVRINGTAAADHGTGTVALLAGGAVQGGRGVYDWPGLRSPRRAQGDFSRPFFRAGRAVGGDGVSGQRGGEAIGGAGGVKLRAPQSTAPNGLQASSRVQPFLAFKPPLSTREP
jgi:hypothetical protein